jgi:hypothetical protein
MLTGAVRNIKLVRKNGDVNDQAHIRANEWAAWDRQGAGRLINGRLPKNTVAIGNGRLWPNSADRQQLQSDTGR